MEPFEQFEQNLREMLSHLYDPVFRPPESLREALGLVRAPGLEGIRGVILEAVEDLKPSERVPLTARAWRIYGMLRHRYVENLPQELTAEQLGITSRHLRRDIGEAIHALALYLWEKNSQPDAPSVPAPGPAITPEWHAQLRKEIDSLEETGPVAGVNVAEALEAAFRLGSYLTERRGIALHLQPVTPGLMAAIHPSALRQILITVIDRLAHDMENGEIGLSAQAAGEKILITVTGEPVHALLPGDLDYLQEFITSRDGSLDVDLRADRIDFCITLLLVDRCVLVVDDNPDIVHLYRRYTAGTRFYIQHVSQGKLLFDAIEQHHPNIIVLDVMLPDIDGWDLLTRLHENPATRAIPTVVCSVMHEEELALALNARYYLTKPVQRNDFLNALHQVQPER